MTIGGVSAANGVAPERMLTGGRVEVTDSVFKKRTLTIGRVGAAGVLGQCGPTAGRIASATGVV